MPIRPANLATMSATIAGALGGASADGNGALKVTLTYESGHRQVIGGGGCRVLNHGEGGVIAIDTESPTKYALFAAGNCQSGRALASGSGSVRFGDPVPAGAIVLG